MSTTPELDKQSEAIKSGAADAIGDFIDWLAEQGMVIHAWRDDLTDWFPCQGQFGDGCKSEGCRRCGGAGGQEGEVHPQYVPISESPEVLMARYFGIDLKKVEAERRALLANIRAFAA